MTLKSKKSEDINLEMYLTAYPNYDEYFYSPAPHNTAKWIDAVKDIYYKEREGSDKRSAILHTIGKWDDMEKEDFFNWLKFYEEGAHLKYKYAQEMWYQGLSPGYILPYKKDVMEADTNDAGSLEEISTAEKKKIIEQQRKKIIGRLDSAEKLLRSDEGQLFAGKEFEALLEIIYQLKKKIQLINKKSASTKLYDDMIVREANLLNKKGFSRAANVLYKLANGENVTQPVSPDAPIENGGLPSTEPRDPVGVASAPNNTPNLATVPAKDEEAPSEGIEEFLEGLEGGNISDTSDTNDLEVFDEDLEVVKEAQEAAPENLAPAETAPPPPAEPPADEGLEVSEETDKPTNDSNLEVTEKVPARNFDSMIDSAFQNLKVDDVVAKLEDLAKIFKTREVPRQLSIVDMMLDTLGLSSFFPSLAEATNKSLESNQYVLTRIEDILSKLRGTMQTNEIDLTSESPASQSPEVQAIKGKLTDQEEKEKARKQMRKNIEEKKLQEQSKEEPEVEMEELEAPVELAPGTPAAPAPAPAAPPK